jgi:hypothetical protein
MNTNNGWKLVPVEPTAEMWAAVNKLDDQMAAGGYDGKGASIEQVWNCLVETAPEAPPLTVTVDPDPRGVSVGVYQGSSCVYHGAHPIPAGAVADEGAKDERQAFEAWAKKKKMPLARIGQQYDDFWVDHAWNGWQARAALAAPAAGDARALAFVQEVAQQKPEKPDHWSSCGQCASNISHASDLLDEIAASQQGGE